MAEIRVQPNPRSRLWLWLLLTLAVVALAAWYLVREGVVTVRQTGLAPVAAPAQVGSAPGTPHASGA